MNGFLSLENLGERRMLRVDEIEADNEEEGRAEKRFLWTRVSFLGGMTRKKKERKRWPREEEKEKKFFEWHGIHK